MTSLGAAPIASPTFTGVPAGPTAVAGTNTTQLATTAFVQGTLTGAFLPLTGGTLTGVLNVNQNAVASGSLPALPAGRDLSTRHAGADNANTTVWLDAWGTTNAPHLAFRDARGTGAAATATLSGDVLGTIDGYGATGANTYTTSPAFQIAGNAIENWGATAQGASITFATNTAGGSTLTNRLAIRQGLVVGGATGGTAGDMGAGTINLTAAPYINGTQMAGGTLPLTVPQGGTNTTSLPLPTGTAAANMSFSNVFLTSTGSAVSASGMLGNFNDYSIVSMSASGGVGAPFQAGTCGGTLAAPAASPSGSLLAGLAGFGWVTGWTAARARINAVTTELWSATGNGTQLQFLTTATGTTTTTQRMTIAQGVVIGNTSPDPGQGGLVLNASVSPVPAAVTNWTGSTIGQVVGQSDAAGTAGGLVGISYTNTAGEAPWVAFLRGRGTAAAPLAVLSGDILGAVSFTGTQSATAFGNVYPGINFYAAENWSATANGTYMTFRGVPTGTTSIQSLMQLDSQRGISVLLGGTAIPTIGTAGPGVTVVNQGTGTQSALKLFNYGGTGARVNCQHYAALGTQAAPTALDSGRYYGVWGWYGWNGSAWGSGVEFDIVAAEAWSATANGARLEMYTTPIGSTTMVQSLTLMPSGGVSIGASREPGATNLIVNTNAPPAAIASLGYILAQNMVVLGGNCSANAYYSNTAQWLNWTAGYGGIFNIDLTGGNVAIYNLPTSTAAGAVAPITQRLQITPAGVCSNTNGTWAAISDIRTKKEGTIMPYERGLDAILGLRPVTYQTSGFVLPDDGIKRWGMVADEVEKVMPELCEDLEILLVPNTEERVTVKTVDPGRAIYALINAVRELAAEVEQLKKKP